MDKMNKKTKTLQNAFDEIAVDNNFCVEILKDIYGINLSEQEVTKLKLYLRYETKGSLHSNIQTIYNIIGANFASPEKVLVIPFLKNGIEYLNIQRIGRWQNTTF